MHLAITWHRFIAELPNTIAAVAATTTLSEKKKCSWSLSGGTAATSVEKLQSSTGSHFLLFARSAC